MFQRALLLSYETFQTNVFVHNRYLREQSFCRRVPVPDGCVDVAYISIFVRGYGDDSLWHVSSPDETWDQSICLT